MEAADTVTNLPSFRKPHRTAASSLIFTSLLQNLKQPIKAHRAWWKLSWLIQLVFVTGNNLHHFTLHEGLLYTCLLSPVPNGLQTVNSQVSALSFLRAGLFPIIKEVTGSGQKPSFPPSFILPFISFYLLPSSSTDCKAPMYKFNPVNWRTLPISFKTISSREPRWLRQRERHNYFQLSRIQENIQVFWFSPLSLTSG